MLHPIFLRLQSEWRQNSRLHMGAWAIALVLLAYLWLAIGDRQEAIRLNYRNLAERVARLESLSREGEWPARAAAARALRVQAEERLWRADSRGLAQANIQTWLDAILKQHQILEPRMQVEAAIDIADQENIWQVIARIEGPFDAKKVIDLLHTLETDEHLAVIESFEIPESEKPWFVLVVTAYFLEPLS